MRTHILTFIDLLGFAGKVQQAHTQRDVDQIILQISRMISNFGMDAENGENPVGDVSFLNFSDSIIRLKLAEQNISVVLQEEIERLSDAQLWSILDGVLVRGGISVAKHFNGQINVDNIGDVACMISPALILSYKLETQKANYPRLVISEDNLPPNFNSPYLIHDRRDGVFYIDYMKRNFDLNQDDDDSIEFLQRHVNLIETGLGNQNRKIKLKYTWLKKYHNRSVRNFLQEKWDNFDEESKLEFGSFRKFLSYYFETLPLVD